MNIENIELLIKEIRDSSRGKKPCVSMNWQERQASSALPGDRKLLRKDRFLYRHGMQGKWVRPILH